MVKMADRNAQLKNALGRITPKEHVKEIVNIPKEDAKNIQGHAAYSLPDKLRLVTMLNTLKVQPQFYRSETETMRELRDLIERLAMKDPYFVAQAIVWSRCCGEGMRTINHLAAALLAPYVAGHEYAKRFYGSFDKKFKRGGCIFRVDDMSEIKDAFVALAKSPLTNAMKKGFATTLENLDTYQLAKYSKTVIDIANLAHPKSANSNAEIEVTVDGNKVRMKTLDAIMQGYTVSADTWEVAQSEAGQEVAKAVREGKLTKAEAQEVLSEAKAQNWETLLADGKLGVIAALRNIRNILKDNPKKQTITAWCKLIKDEKLIQKALVLPIHFDLAYDVVKSEFNGTDYVHTVCQALLDGYQKSIPNLAASLPGRTAIIVDCSGSMGGYAHLVEGKSVRQSYGWNTTASNTNSCAYKAGLIAATIAKATGADVYKFGSRANKFNYDKKLNVFELAKTIGTATDGCTNPHAAFQLLTQLRAAYDRIIFISDNEVNGRITSEAYKTYIRNVCSPYIYAVDLAAYGTTPLRNDGKISYLFGYGPTLYNAIASQEFNPQKYLEEIEKIEI